jgi:hypothetical protein
VIKNVTPRTNNVRTTFCAEKNLFGRIDVQAANARVAEIARPHAPFDFSSKTKERYPARLLADVGESERSSARKQLGYNPGAFSARGTLSYSRARSSAG